MKQLDTTLIACAREALSPTARDESRVFEAVRKRLMLEMPSRNGQPRERSGGGSKARAEPGDTPGRAARHGSSGGTTGRAAPGGASSGAMGRAAMSSRGWAGFSQLSVWTKAVLGVVFLAGTGLGVGAKHLSLGSQTAPVPRILSSGPALSESAQAVPPAAARDEAGAPAARAAIAGFDRPEAIERPRRHAAEPKALGTKARGPRGSRGRLKTEAPQEAPPSSGQNAASLRPELEALQQAERALRHGDPWRAFWILQDCERLVGAGSMREERLALSNVARCTMSIEQRTQSLSRFLSEYPTSTYAERVRQSCTPR